MSAKDYPVFFGYGAKDGYYYGPNGIIGPYHRGNDFSTPAGTDVIVNNQLIGRTGATGAVSGPHIHVQLAPEADPTGKEWNVPNGVVTETGTKLKEGKYIKIQGSDGITRMYFHLSEVLVTKDQQIGEPMGKWDNGKTFTLLFKACNQAIAQRAEDANYVGYFGAEDGKDAGEAYDNIIGSSQFDYLVDEARKGAQTSSEFVPYELPKLFVKKG